MTVEEYAELRIERILEQLNEMYWEVQDFRAEVLALSSLLRDGIPSYQDHQR
jgi:hypothetical protein